MPNKEAVSSLIYVQVMTMDIDNMLSEVYQSMVL